MLAGKKAEARLVKKLYYLPALTTLFLTDLIKGKQNLA
jgi:hypothetical protein